MYKMCLLLIICTAAQTKGLECLKCVSVKIRSSVPFGFEIPVNAALRAFTSTNCASAKTDSSIGVSQRTCPRSPEVQRVYTCGMFTGTANVSVIVTSVSVSVEIRDCFLVDKSFGKVTCSSDMSIVYKQLESIASAINTFSFNLATIKGRFCINRSTKNQIDYNRSTKYPLDINRSTRIQFLFWMLVFMFFTATFILN